MKEEEESSDIGALWKEALEQHRKESKLEPALEREMMQQMSWDVNSIMQEQNRQLEVFSKTRHSGTVLDKLRSAVGRNSAIIVGVATQVGNAASSSFPPAAAIVTAFTYVMKASTDVSADLDKLAGFFDVMGSILQRVSIIEKKLPTVKAYKSFITKVFSDLMILCGIATFYVRFGRFKLWIKALASGQDDKLKSAYDNLEKDIQKLESATMFATLTTAIDIKSDVKDLSVIAKQNLKVGIETLFISKESLSINIDTNTLVKDAVAVSKETADGVKAFIKMYNQKKREEDAQKDVGKRGSNKANDSGAKRSVTLNQVKTSFANQADPVVQFRDIESSFVKGTFGWIEHEDGYKSFLDGGPYLWIYGHRGLGKSCLAYSIIHRLAESYGNQPRTSVAYFFFKEEHEELRSVKNMLSSIVIQVAVADETYRNEVAADLVRRNVENFDEDDGPQIWERYFVNKYSKDSDAKLFLVIDGFDEADPEGRAKLLGFLQQISKDAMNIQVVLSGRPEMNSDIEILQPLKIEITKQKLSERSGDLWRIIIARCKTLSKLRRLQPLVRKKIAVKLRQRADSVLYVEHMLRRLNALGRENLIIKELEQLPPDLTALYALMLSDCQKHRSDEQLTTLKKLFAWLAYSKRPLTLGEATSLVAVVEKQTSFSLEEEIDGRSARILQLSSNTANDEQSSDESDSDIVDKQEDEDPAESIDNSIYSPLRFQERSLRQYFRETSIDEAGLRSPPSLAHVTIFNMAVRCLDVLVDLNPTDTISYNLQNYAANYWLQHFLDIQPDSIPDEDTQGVIESLHMVFDPNKNILKSLEFHCREHVGLFSGATDLQEKFLNSLKDWAESAINLPAGISNNDLSWIQNFSNSPTEVMAQVARGHKSNWFKANASWEARRSFLFARAALHMTDLMPEDLEATNHGPPKQEVILWMANVLDDTPKPPSAHRAIGMVLGHFGFYDAALLELDKSLQLCDSILERFKTLQEITSVELDYSEDEKFENSSNEHIDKAYEAINTALAMRSEVKEDDTKIEKDGLLSEALVERAVLEVKLGKLEEALSTIDEVRALVKDANMSSREFNEIMKAFEKRNQYDKIMSAVEKFTKWDLLGWLAWGSDEDNEIFRHAAKQCDKKDFMIQTYGSIMRWLDELGESLDGAGIRLQLAIAYQRVFPNLKEAKRLLYEIIEGKKSGAPLASNTIFSARLNLADILMEEFRNTKDPEEKSRVYAEMKSLAFRNHVAIAEPYESQTAIPMALMARRLGPASEFQSGMEEIFKGCFKALTDKDGWNDSEAFRLLAKVLAWVPGLEGDAQISVSLQFSCVDKEVFKTQNGSPDAAGTDGTVAGATNGSLFENNQAEPEEDLAFWSIQCNGCDKVIENWKDGPFYLCVVCTDIDLCLECYNKIQARNQGGEWKEWQTICGLHHRYVGPVKDWKGVKDGVIRFGEEKVAFTEWLKDLNEKRWRGAWLNWWQKDDLVDDIL